MVMRTIRLGAVALGAFLLLSAPAGAQDGGIPIASEVVRTRCGGCHTSDSQNRMSRISYRRATPENWERTVKRMVTLNKVNLEPKEAREIVKYLSDHLGLAPEEARQGANEAERRLTDFSYTADKDTADLCGACHAVTRVVNERRTKQEWELLVAMHRGYYPLVDNQPMSNGQGFRRTRAVAPAGDGASDAPPDTRHPMERAIAHLAKVFPLQTPEWSAWTAGMQPPKLAGRWGISGYQAGKGPIVGVLTVTADPAAADAFVTELRYTVTRSGETVARSGRSVVYTGFQWRGRSNPGQGPADQIPWREVMSVDRDWKRMSGRWFTGGYDEIGMDVQLERLGSEPALFGASVTALKAGAAAQRVKVYGANLPARIKASDIGFGQGVTVTRLVSATGDELSVDVDVAADAKIGPRDLSVATARRAATVVVYDRIAAIQVRPTAGMARLGGPTFPKQLQQFEAVAFAGGPDGKAGTSDDLLLGPVDVKWSLEEYTATFGDDDLKFVGAIDATGLFTPSVDGPNPDRSGSRNNIGDVWVVAELPGEGTARPLRARGHLLVTVPVYMNWYSSEPSR
jgi:quinohemoprotein amine dehydrogenase